MMFEDPTMLLLLFLVPLVWVNWFWQRRRVPIRFSTVSWFKRHGATLGVRARVVIPLLRTAALVVLAIALARPRKGDRQTRIYAEGIAIEMVVDISGSMRALDFAVEGKTTDRLEAVKHVARQFVAGSDDLAGRMNDLIGVITFARYADSKCPLTLDHRHVLRVLEKTEIVNPRIRGEDGTAIGDAIALGVERLKELQRRAQGAAGSKDIESKVMIVLTDGVNNRGEIEPIKAAEIAAAYGIKIYTIGAGTKGEAPYPMGPDFLGRPRLVPMRDTIDEETLTKVAEITDGQYFRATDVESLRQIYDVIDKLERTEVQEIRYLQYAEQAPSLMLLAFGLVGLEVLLVNTRFRRIP